MWYKAQGVEASCPDAPLLRATRALARTPRPGGGRSAHPLPTPPTHTHTRARARAATHAQRAVTLAALSRNAHMAKGKAKKKGGGKGKSKKAKAPAICTADEDLAPFGLRCDDILLTPMGLTAVVAGVKYEDPTTKVRRRGVRPRCPPAPQPARAASSTHAWLVRRRRNGTRARATKGHTRALLLPGTLRG